DELAVPSIDEMRREVARDREELRAGFVHPNPSNYAILHLIAELLARPNVAEELSAQVPLAAPGGAKGTGCFFIDDNHQVVNSMMAKKIKPSTIDERLPTRVDGEGERDCEGEF